MQTKLDHFADVAPQELAQKLSDIAQAVRDDFISEPTNGWHEPYACARITEIHGKGYDGFIPFQNGGFEVSEFFRSDTDSTYHFTAAQSAALQEDEKNLYESFFLDNKEELSAMGLDKSFSYSDLDGNAELQNAFSDYEVEWYNPALLRFEVWIERPHRTETQEENRVFFRVSLNYKDSPYYRSKSDETLFEFNLPMQAMLKKSPEFFIKLLKRKMKAIA